MRGALVQPSGAPRVPSMSSLNAAVTTALPRASLAATWSPAIRRFVRRHGMRLSAARFVAGETLDEVSAGLDPLTDALEQAPQVAA